MYILFLKSSLSTKFWTFKYYDLKLKAISTVNKNLYTPAQRSLMHPFLWRNCKLSPPKESWKLIDYDLQIKAISTVSDNFYNRGTPAQSRLLHPFSWRKECWKLLVCMCGAGGVAAAAAKRIVFRTMSIFWFSGFFWQFIILGWIEVGQSSKEPTINMK